MQKIVHVIASLDTGGAEIMLCRLLRGMDRQRFKPVVIALMPGGSLEGDIEAMGIPLYHAGMRQGRPSLIALWRLVRILRRERPDVVQGWMVHGNLAAQVASRFLTPRPYVCWAVHHSQESLHREKWLTALLIRLSARLARPREKSDSPNVPERIVYVSQVSRNQHERLGFDPARGTTIPNGIDPDVFGPSEAARAAVRRELGVSEDAMLIGLMGRFHPQKNHAGFLRAARTVVEQCPSASIVLAGSGTEPGNKRLAALARECGVEAVLHALGERRDMPRLTAALDIAVSASSYGEALSLAVAEAMACEVPCVVANVGDNGLLVGQTGAVIPPGEPALLAEACLSLIRIGPSGRKALGAMARERILCHYALPGVTRQYEEFYSSLGPKKEL